MYDYDYLIVGGGICGLLTALRLADSGASVGLLEKSKIGSGASLGNQGIIHSGALYAELHPEVIDLCKEAYDLFTTHFGSAVFSTRESLFFASQPRMDSIQRIWSDAGVAFESADGHSIAEFIHSGVVKDIAGALVKEPTVLSSRILAGLVQRCINKGVEVHTNIPVRQLVCVDRNVYGVRVGLKEVIRAKTFILTTGLGTTGVAEGLTLKSVRRLKSRLTVMVACRNITLDRPLLCLDFGGPTLVPSYHNTVLASLYGGRQSVIKRSEVWSVPVNGLKEVLSQVRKYLREDVISLNDARAYMHPKTEVSSGKEDFAGVEPGYAILDHKVLDGVGNLWTIIPGKMTFAFHASAVLTSLLLGKEEPVDIPGKEPVVSEAALRMVQREPWRQVR